MANNSNITITAYEQYVLAGWKAYGEFPAAATKAVPVTLYTIGLLANTTLIIYLLHSRRCCLVIFALLTSLAMCDWLTSFSLINMALFMLPKLVFVRGAKQVCWVISYVTMTSYTASICHVMALAALRFYQMVYPLQAKAHVTTGRVVKCCFGMWIFCAAVAIPSASNHAVTSVLYNDKTLLIWHFAGNDEAREICLSIFAQGIPLVVIALLHLTKLFKLRKVSNISESKRRISSSRTVTFLIICFVITILPRFLHMCYHKVLGYPYRVIHMGLTYYSGVILSANSIVDPFLYLLSSNEVRQDIYRRMQCKTIKMR